MIRIGLVDDHTMFRRGLKSLIEFFPDCSVVVEAVNGKDFIKKLDVKSLPDIVLLDIKMAEMDGYETAEWIRDNHPTIRVLALSTMDAELNIIRMIKAGARGYILKDAEPEELKLAFEQVQSMGFYYNNVVTRAIMSNIHHIMDEKNQVGMAIRINDRELHFLKLACSERTYQQVADEMNLSERTIDGYRESLFQKLGVTSRVGLVLYAVKNGFVSL